MRAGKGRVGEGRSTYLSPRFDNPGYRPVRGGKGRGRRGREGKGRGGERDEKGKEGGKGPSPPRKKILAPPLLKPVTPKVEIWYAGRHLQVLWLHIKN